MSDIFTTEKRSEVMKAVKSRNTKTTELKMIQIFKELHIIGWEYPDLTVHLTLFNATIAEGEPVMLEHNDIQWITPSEIPNYEFCPADEEILHKIILEYK